MRSAFFSINGPNLSWVGGYLQNFRMSSPLSFIVSCPCLPDMVTVVCVCVRCVSVSQSPLFPCLQQSALQWEGGCDEVLSHGWQHVVSHRCLHSHLPGVEGTGTTTLGSVGCVLVMGNNLWSESDPLRKQVSGKWKSMKLVIWHGEKKETHRLVTFFTFHLVAVTPTEAGLVRTNALNSFDQDSVHTALKLSSKLINRVTINYLPH